MKKLQLNKETIARLNNPDEIYGGEKYTEAQTCGTCAFEEITCAPTPKMRCDRIPGGGHDIVVW
ncbi:MAG: class I lanthipeptide [Bacteroidetes bacterium]|nr:class I lanthipeptide [Bacteroidota bacterium]MCL2302828.1 class I lanthipeptide [Lentimicrobiaceae bacterium]